MANNGKGGRVEDKFAKFLKDKFRWYCKQRELDPLDTPWVVFANWLDIHPSTLSTHVKGRKKPTGETVHKYAAKLGPNVYDILEEPRRMPEDPRFMEIATYYFDMTEDEQKELWDVASEIKDGKFKGLGAPHEA